MPISTFANPQTRRSAKLAKKRLSKLTVTRVVVTKEFIVDLFDKSRKLAGYVLKYLVEAKVKRVCQTLLGFDPYSQEEERYQEISTTTRAVELIQAQPSPTSSARPQLSSFSDEVSQSCSHDLRTMNPNQVGTMLGPADAIALPQKRLHQIPPDVRHVDHTAPLTESCSQEHFMEPNRTRDLSQSVDQASLESRAKDKRKDTQALIVSPTVVQTTSIQQLAVTSSIPAQETNEQPNSNSTIGFNRNSVQDDARMDDFPASTIQLAVFHSIMSAVRSAIRDGADETVAIIRMNMIIFRSNLDFPPSLIKAAKFEIKQHFVKQEQLRTQ